MGPQTRSYNLDSNPGTLGYKAVTQPNVTNEPNYISVYGCPFYTNIQIGDIFKSQTFKTSD